jgi:hypothetical protein
MSLLSSLGIGHKPKPQPAIRLEPVRGGIPAVIKLCDEDPARAYNLYIKPGNEKPVLELIDKQMDAVQQYKFELIADHDASTAAIV